MSLTVKSLNGDTAFLLTFRPPLLRPDLSPSSLGPCPGSFTILVDPWLVGPSIILNSAFSISKQKVQPCIAHLDELEHEPDVVLISQDKPDHCHEATLRQLPPDCGSTIFATPAAARKIRSWKHFRPERVKSLSKYVEGDEHSIHRILLPLALTGSHGEVTITWMPAKRDITALHHAFGITYRPPGAGLKNSSGSYLDLPTSLPASPGSLRTISSCSSPRTIVPSPWGHVEREKTISVLYAPHGVSFDVIRPYAVSHLVFEAALPLTALIHSLDRVENPWYLGGNISAGHIGGVQIARELYAQAWIAAHDADKDNRGWSVKQTRVAKCTIDQATRLLGDDDFGREKQKPGRTRVVSLASGGEFRIERG
ncbi:hypothetical protein P153DRAFT_339565 [Dothidotthia symphoricarpi CBS 119687]|uniref:Metallo-beta-lactamase domain-containing protein n=1 Tax=Dothidotthia symphoricarpi CBS 119687 TaxID=1392245 RepID=A0A6A6AGP6_9PLEO|nr:uncharacterized protein P153DRAFT_339565 [Dothidotthia symphoricarpi CBS 119687]KAF2130067.1 hypothetical protein P153DRAFT_339565 [Dothidotthia symphoricarpi CBS 119687]